MAQGEAVSRWRGFALPRLQSKHNALVSTVILGILWALWHIPHSIGQGQIGVSFIATRRRRGNGPCQAADWKL